MALPRTNDQLLLLRSLYSGIFQIRGERDWVVRFLFRSSGDPIEVQNYVLVVEI